MTFAPCAGQAQNFHFAHIDWKMCQDTVRNGQVVPGFYDPAFPEVCADRTSARSARRVGFTIHSAWPNGDWNSLSMLEDYSTQIANFRDKCNGELKYDPPEGMSTLCYLTVSRNGATPSPDRARTIGWYKGLGTKTIPPPGGGGIVSQAAVNSRDALPGKYNFVIERENRDYRLMHARYSFEIEFGEANEYYSVYFEGCCRPRTLKNNKVMLRQRHGVLLSTFSPPPHPLSLHASLAGTHVSP